MAAGRSKGEFPLQYFLKEDDNEPPTSGLPVLEETGGQDEPQLLCGIHPESGEKQLSQLAAASQVVELRQARQLQCEGTEESSGC